jgi:tryptophanyl-tRNA synthetase
MDNQANVELARELARRFNHLYEPVFPIPDIQPEETLIGTDGQAKMSKSLGNTIYLSDSAATVERKVMGMYTDPNRITADTPGQVAGNPVFIYHDAFNLNIQEVEDLKTRYSQGRVGDVEVKGKLAAAINHLLDPIRERRAAFEQKAGLVTDILNQGNQRMQAEARTTLSLVRDAMGIATYDFNTIQQDPTLGTELAGSIRGLAFV